MSIFYNKTSKIRPDPKPLAQSPQGKNPQSYRLPKASESETYVLDEIFK